MEVKFADTFGDSLKRLMWHESKIYKFYAFFRYDIGRFVKNIWRFRKALNRHYWWDHHGALQFMEISLTHISDNLEKRGLEVDGPRLKKVAKMRRAVELIKNYNQDNYIEMAEAELGEIIHHDWEFEEVPDKPGFSQLIDKDTDDEKEHNRKVFSRAREIEEAEWTELWTILQGQNRTQFTMFQDKSTDKDSAWDNWFDGSGMKGWWD
jgi:hypothetical protein